MTATARQPTQRSAESDRDLRVELIPARPPHLTDDGRTAVPMWVLRDEKHIGDTEMLLSHDETIALVERLGGALAIGRPQ